MLQVQLLACAGFLVSDPGGSAFADRLTPGMAAQIMPWLGLMTEGPEEKEGVLRLFLELAKRHPSVVPPVLCRTSGIQHPKGVTPEEWQAWWEEFSEALDKAGVLAGLT